MRFRSFSDYKLDHSYNSGHVNTGTVVYRRDWMKNNNRKNNAISVGMCCMILNRH